MLTYFYFTKNDISALEFVADAWRNAQESFFQCGSGLYIASLVVTVMKRKERLKALETKFRGQFKFPGDIPVGPIPVGLTTEQLEDFLLNIEIVNTFPAIYKSLNEARAEEMKEKVEDLYTKLKTRAKILGEANEKINFMPGILQKLRLGINELFSLRVNKTGTVAKGLFFNEEMVLSKLRKQELEDRAISLNDLFFYLLRGEAEIIQRLSSK